MNKKQATRQRTQQRNEDRPRILQMTAKLDEYERNLANPTHPLHARSTMLRNEVTIFWKKCHMMFPSRHFKQNIYFHISSLQQDSTFLLPPPSSTILPLSPCGSQLGESLSWCLNWLSEPQHPPTALGPASSLIPSWHASTNLHLQTTPGQATTELTAPPPPTTQNLDKYSLRIIIPKSCPNFPTPTPLSEQIWRDTWGKWPTATDDY